MYPVPKNTNRRLRITSNNKAEIYIKKKQQKGSSTNQISPLRYEPPRPPPFNNNINYINNINNLTNKQMDAMFQIAGDAPLDLIVAFLGGLTDAKFSSPISICLDSWWIRRTRLSLCLSLCLSVCLSIFLSVPGQKGWRGWWHFPSTLEP